jgi:hypothetical protein
MVLGGGGGGGGGSSSSSISTNLGTGYAFSPHRQCRTLHRERYLLLAPARVISSAQPPLRHQLSHIYTALTCAILAAWYVHATCTNSHSSAHITSTGASVPCQVLHFSTAGTHGGVRVRHDAMLQRACLMQVEIAYGVAGVAAAIDFDLGVDGGGGAAAAAAGGMTGSGATAATLRASFFKWN